MSVSFIQSVIIGIGFSKKISAITLKESIYYIQQHYHYDMQILAIPAFKQQDKNTIKLQNLIDIPIQYIPYEQLLSVQQQCQSYSAITKKHTGLGAVAEACVLAIMTKDDRLLIPKMIYNNISFSVAIKG